MGPQLDSCGWFAEKDIGAANGPLQWGRNLTVADGSDRPYHHVGIASMGPQLDSCGWPAHVGRAPLTNPLQWGRNLTVADGRGRWMQAASTLGFNGAAT